MLMSSHLNSEAGNRDREEKAWLSLLSWTASISWCLDNSVGLCAKYLCRYLISLEIPAKAGYSERKVEPGA